MTLLDPRGWLAAVLALAMAYGAGRWQQSAHDKARFAAERTAAALVAAQARNQAVDAVRAEEQRRTFEQRKIVDDATQQAEAARNDKRAADDVARRLQLRVDELLAAARAAGNPGTPRAGAGQPGGDPLDVLVDVLRGADQAAGEMAGYADQLRVRGLACERAYDSLTGITLH